MLRFQAREPRAFREIDLCDKENDILKSTQRFFYNLNALDQGRDRNCLSLAVYPTRVPCIELLEADLGDAAARSIWYGPFDLGQQIRQI
jgi:hypothetical protein